MPTGFWKDRIRKRPNKLAITHCDDSLKLECLHKRSIVAEFCDVLRAVDLIPGVDDRGAVIRRWTDPIHEHDVVVRQVEEVMDYVADKEKRYQEAAWIALNYNCAWTHLERTNQSDMYWEWYKLTKMFLDCKDLNAVYKSCESMAEYRHKKKQWNRRIEIDHAGHKMNEVYKSFLKAKKTRDKLAIEVDRAKRRLQKIMKHEAELAEKISDDHTQANQLGIPFPELNPAVEAGMILYAVNGVQLDFRDFEYITLQIQALETPHICEFKRYDYRWNDMYFKWESIQSLREQGRYWVDARRLRTAYLEACNQGNLEEVKALVFAGQEVDMVDESGNSGLHYAATNGHEELVVYLVKECKARIDLRNENMETPLLYCARRGSYESIPLLLSLGAKIEVTDRFRRHVLFHSILGGNVEVTKFFLDLLLLEEIEEDFFTSKFKSTKERERLEVLEAQQAAADAKKEYSNSRNSRSPKSKINTKTNSDSRNNNQTNNDNTKTKKKVYKVYNNFSNYQYLVTSQESQWGWTLLHCAASRGLEQVIQWLLLLDTGVHRQSFPPTSHDVLEVAKHANQPQAIEMIEKFILFEPAHQVDKYVWVGGKGSLSPHFVQLIGFQSILNLIDTGKSNTTKEFQEMKSWIESEEVNIEVKIRRMRLTDPYNVFQKKNPTNRHIPASERNNTGLWERIVIHIKPLIEHIQKCITQERVILITSEFEGGVAEAICMAHRILKERDTYKNSLHTVMVARKLAKINPEILRGIMLMEEDMKVKQRQLLSEKARNTMLLSCAF